MKLFEEEKPECFTIPLQKSFDDLMQFETLEETYTEEIYEIPLKGSMLLLLDDSRNNDKAEDLFYDLTILEKCNII
ncbi:MAG: hypothetical protein KHZ72_13520 [Lachnospiraceae bacterium]|nr:hypothetical protein [Lachnospiraceae bacterium]